MELEIAELSSWHNPQDIDCESQESTLLSSQGTKCQEQDYTEKRQGAAAG